MSKKQGEEAHLIAEMIDFLLELKESLTLMSVPIQRLENLCTDEREKLDLVQQISANTDLFARRINLFNVKLSCGSEDIVLNKSYTSILGVLEQINKKFPSPNIQWDYADIQSGSEEDFIDPFLLEKAFENLITVEQELYGNELSQFNFSIASGQELVDEFLKEKKYKGRVLSCNIQVAKEAKGVRKVNGTIPVGIGAARELLELHGGGLEILNDAHGHPVIKWAIPLDSDSNVKRAIVTEDQPPLVPETDIPDPEAIINEAYKEAKILVVDDVFLTRELLYEILHEDYQVILAENGDEGLKKTLESHPDLVLTDLKMYPMTGIELCEAIKTKEETSHIPVIFLSGDDTMEARLSSLKHGANDFITKPFNHEELQLRIRNFIENRKSAKINFFKNALMQPKDMKLGTNDRNLLEKAVKITEENLDNNEFSVEDFAKEMFVSKTQLNRKMKALTGLSPNEFLRTYRLKYAAKLLLNDDYLIAEVATMVGFNDPRYFSRSFKAIFKMTPREYKRHHLGEE